jgi:hypothetical protein
MSVLTDAEIKNIPLEERFRHSFWKARANACEEIESLLSDANPAADLFSDYRMCNDSHSNLELIFSELAQAFVRNRQECCRS